MVKIYSCYDEIKTLFEPKKKLSLTFDGKNNRIILKTRPPLG